MDIKIRRILLHLT